MCALLWPAPGYDKLLTELYEWYLLYLFLIFKKFCLLCVFLCISKVLQDSLLLFALLLAVNNHSNFRIILLREQRVETDEEWEQKVSNLETKMNTLLIYLFFARVWKCCRSQWPRGLRYGSTAASLLGLWVRIPPEAWMSVSCKCCVLSGRGLCDGLVPRPEESYRVWCV
jgi:hypothetical protein